MPTKLALNQKLIADAVRLGNRSSEREAVTEALKEYVCTRKRLEILQWIGRVDYYDDYDHKKARKSRIS